MKWRNGLVLLLVLITAVVIAGCSTSEPVSEEPSPPEVTREAAVEEVAVESMKETTTEPMVEEVVTEVVTEEVAKPVETSEAVTTSTEEVTLGILTPDLTLERDKLVLDFALENLNGEVVQLSDYRGNLVLLNFWTTW